MKYKSVNFYREVVDIETVKIIVTGASKQKDMYKLAKVFIEKMHYRNVHVYSEDVYKIRYYVFSYVIMIILDFIKYLNVNRNFNKKVLIYY